MFSLPAFAGTVDGLGFGRAWFAEHHFQPHGGILSAPDVLVGRALRIRFGLGILQVPYHHQLSVATLVV